jgi:hypothetical protein
MFDKYPTVLLFKAGDKLNPINYNKDWLHGKRRVCACECVGLCMMYA